MNDNFKNNLFYPEFFTHQSIRLETPPQANDIPDTGYMYVWYSYINEKMYMNIKLDDGTIKNCPMFEQIKQKVTFVAPNELESTIFELSDISESVISNKKILVVNNNFSIANVNVYLNELKQEKIQVSCPIYSNGTVSYLDLTDVSSQLIQYGGEIVYSQGTVVNYGTQDNPYIIPSAQGTTNISALNGLYQSVQSIVDELIINLENLKDMKDNQTLKVYVKNDVEANVVICGQFVSYKKFFVMFGCFDGEVYQIGKIVNISNGE